MALVERGAAFANLVQRAVDTQGQPHSRQDIADHIGISYDSLANRLTGRSSFSADEIQRLLGLLPDLRLLDYLLEQSGHFAASKPEHDVGSFESVTDGAITTSVEASQVLETVHQALADLMICHRDKQAIAKEIADVERALASLTLTLNAS